MKLKNTLLLLAFTVFLFSCQQENETEVNETSADLIANTPENDFSNLGNYQGTFSTLDSELRGTIELFVRDNTQSLAIFKLNDGTSFKIEASSYTEPNTDISNMLFVGNQGSFKFSVNADGTNPTLTDVLYNNRASSIIVMKENSSRGPNTPVTGSYTVDADGGTNTWSVIFSGDGSGDDTAIETQILRAGGEEIGSTTGNTQDNCVVDTPEAGLTQCDFNGVSSAFMLGGVSVTINYTGTHIYDSGATLCSQVSGTWMASVGGATGTFTNDFLCETQPGDVPGTAIALTPNAEGTGCTPAGDVTVDLSAGGGYTDSGVADTACTNTGTDVWYTYTSTTNGLNIFPQSGSSTTLPSVAAYSINGLGGLTELSCAAGNFGGNATIAVFGWEAGDEVLIRIQSTDEVPFCAEEVTVATGPPANDLCADAEAIACGDTVMGSTLTATDADTDRAADVWYLLSGTTVGDEITISLCGSAYDTWLGVYDDCALTTTIASNDDNFASCGAGGNSELTFTSTGIDYFIKVDGFNATNIGDFTIAITCVTPPPPPAGSVITDPLPITPLAAASDCTGDDTVFNTNDLFTDSGLDSSCQGASTGVDAFYSWTATETTVNFTGGSGNPGVVVRFASDGTEVPGTCLGTFGAGDLSGWAIGDDLIFQVYDFNSPGVEVGFCLAFPDPPPPALTCGDQLIDDGGVAANYSNSQDITYTIDAGAGMSATLSFTEFALENGWDYMRIYDGDSEATSPEITTSVGGATTSTANGNSGFTGADLSGDSVVSTGQFLTVVFEADGTSNDLGFIADITCSTLAPQPGNQTTSTFKSAIVGKTRAQVSRENEIKLFEDSKLEIVDKK